MWFDKKDEYLGFADDSQVSNPVWRLFLVCLILWCIASLFGCATFGQQSESGIFKRLHGKRVVTHHVDAGDRPEGCTHGPQGGCMQMRSDGPHIWYSSVSPDYVVRHELAHAFGMNHTLASLCNWGRSVCSTVIAAAPGYPLGATLRVSASGEDVLDAALFAEAK